MSIEQSSPVHRNIWLHRFAVFTACSTFFLIIAGGLVTSTDSGLAVPDWPLSYGQVMPPMVGGIFYEHGHRMVATFVGFLTTVLAIWLWRKEDRKWVRMLGLGSLLAVIVQGVLGGLTVLHLLPASISVSHATLAQTFFCMTILLALVTSPKWRKVKPVELAESRSTRHLMAAVIAVVFLQLILGAVMRHTYSGLAIPDFPLSYGSLLPPSSESDMAALNRHRLVEYDLPPVTMGQIWIHFAHRVGALLVTVVILAALLHIFRTYKADPRMREPALLIGVLLVVQVFLGALTVWSGKSVEGATAHVATGALLLATSVILAARSFHLYRPAELPAATLVAEGGKA
jgi:cytochrome c oxidase assembly protein subunit 15